MSISSDEILIPVGKMKGEINGEFEAFYLAVNQDGIPFINYSISYDDDPYRKSNGWHQITREQLEEYKKELHLIPACRPRGVRR